MLITSTYLRTTRGCYKYLFFLLLEDYVQEQREFSSALKASLERFARSLKDEAALVRPFTGDIEATRQQVLDKRWPGPAEREILSTPSLLMIDRDFDTFHPVEHPWLQIKIPLRGREDATGRMLENLAKLITSDPDDDIFRQARRIVRQGHMESIKILELKPGIFGFSLDLLELVKALEHPLGSRKGRSTNY
jgi:hypothetical protein